MDCPAQTKSHSAESLFRSITNPMMILSLLLLKKAVRSALHPAEKKRERGMYVACVHAVIPTSAHEALHRARGNSISLHAAPGYVYQINSFTPSFPFRRTTRFLSSSRILSRTCSRLTVRSLQSTCVR